MTNLIPDNLKEQLIKEFKSEKKIKNIIDKKEIYKLNNYNSTQILKILNLNSQTIYTEINSKKHLNKISEMIKTNFYNKKTQNYFDYFFHPTNKLNELKKREINIKKTNSNFNSNNNNNSNNSTTTNYNSIIKEIIQKNDELKTKIIFNNTIITLDSNTEKTLYEKYKIHANLYNKKELEELVKNEIELNTIIISEEDLYTQIPTYKLKEFEKIIKGNIIKTNKHLILNIIKFLKETKIIINRFQKTIENISNLKFDLNLNYEKLENILNENKEEILKELTSKTLTLETEVEKINFEIKQIISEKKLSLEGDELLNLLNSGDISSIQNKFKQDTKSIIEKYEKKIIESYKEKGIKINYIFSDSNYPLKLDEEIKDEIIKKIDLKNQELEFKTYENLGNFNLTQIKEIINFIFIFDLINGIIIFNEKYNLNKIKIGDEITLINGKNIYIKNPMPINYSIAGKEINNIKLNAEKICILTGANSGGKTTLLEMNLQSQILTTMGLGIPAKKESTIKLFDEIIYLKKFTGTQGSGAFEQTIRNLIEILDSQTSKLILIDEFEAVTEPGAAAKILIMFLKEIQRQNSFCIAASHLGQEIQEFLKEEKIKGIRIDGISAEGLDEKGNLITNHQPQFYKLGKSTPELILKRILQDEKFWKGKTNESKELLKRISK